MNENRDENENQPETTKVEQILIKEPWITPELKVLTVREKTQGGLLAVMPPEDALYSS